MKLGKKGIVLKVIVTLLVALIIFVPTVLFASQFFSFSIQAKNNFIDFVDQVKKMEKAEIGERETHVLILDKPTAVVYFEKDKDQVRVDVDANCAVTCSDYYFILEKPSQCNNDKGCLCLFREVEYDVSSDWFTVKPKSAICESTELNLDLDHCGIGIPNDVNSYFCSNGFVIERHLADEASWRVDAFFEAPRRIAVTFEKEADQIILEAGGS